MEAAQTAIARAQALLDPTGQGLFTPQRLLPYLNLAYSSLRDEGAAVGTITAAEMVTVVSAFPAYTRDLGAYVAPAGVLQNLAAPLSLREKPVGTDDSNYTSLERVAELPVRSPSARLWTYEWRGGNIYFTGATSAVDLEIRYEQIWPSLNAPTDPLAAIGVATILGYWTAGLMATAMREQQLGTQYISEARHLLDRWLQRQTLDSQSITRRPLPFRSSGSGRNYGISQ